MADIQFNLRISPELKEKIKMASSESGRSINAEAAKRLEDSFDHSVYEYSKQILERIDGVISIVEKQDRALKERDKVIEELISLHQTSELEDKIKELKDHLNKNK